MPKYYWCSDWCNSAIQFDECW